MAPGRISRGDCLLASTPWSIRTSRLLRARKELAQLSGFRLWNGVMQIMVQIQGNLRKSRHPSCTNHIAGRVVNMISPGSGASKPRFYFSCRDRQNFRKGNSYAHCREYPMNGEGPDKDTLTWFSNGQSLDPTQRRFPASPLP